MVANKSGEFESESLEYTLYDVMTLQFISVWVTSSFQSILMIASKLLDKVGVFGAIGTPPSILYS